MITFLIKKGHPGHKRPKSRRRREVAVRASGCRRHMFALHRERRGSLCIL